MCPSFLKVKPFSFFLGLKTPIPRHLPSHGLEVETSEELFHNKSSFTTLWRANQPSPIGLSPYPHIIEVTINMCEWERERQRQREPFQDVGEGCTAWGSSAFHSDGYYGRLHHRIEILAKTAMTNGMSPFVFVVYTNAIASIILLFPYSFIFHCWDRFCSLFFIIFLFLT